MLRGYSRGSSESSEEREFLNWDPLLVPPSVQALVLSDRPPGAGPRPRGPPGLPQSLRGPSQSVLLHLRIQHAQDLLHHTSLTMREI